MFERFTDRARRVVVLAQEEARLLHHNYIGTEHILLGLIHESEGVAAQALTGLGVSLEGIREHVEDVIGPGASSPSGHIPFTPRAKKVLELSLREALQLGHNYVGTEHLLLGIIREGEGVGAHCLVNKFNVDLDTARQAVISILKGQRPMPQPELATKKTPEMWYLVEYLSADAAPTSMTVNSPDGWRADDDPLGFIYIGGHAIKSALVTSIFRVSGPPAANTTTPAGMKPLAEKVTVHSDPATNNPPLIATGDGSKEKPYTIVEAAIPPSQMTVAQRKAAVESALNVARRNDPDYGDPFTGEPEDPDLAEFRMKQWGDAMQKAIARARESMGQSRLAGGIIYIPDDGTAPSYIAPDPVGLDMLEDIFSEYENKVAEVDIDRLRSRGYLE